ncbi:MAG: serine hydrolase [Candidatus Aminicenantes bacterium]|nr:MAG: serine hydrolase [Candidatus Aminicenantes bacterium]
MKERITKLLCLTLVFLFVPCFAQAFQEITITEEVKESIKERIEKGESVGIVVGIIDSQGRREFFSFGKTRIKGKRSVDEYSIYEIGSISKVFTCIAFADMLVNRELNLDDPIEKFLPGGVKIPSRNGMKITLKHLATHTSALPRMPFNLRPTDPSNPYADFTVKEMYDCLSGIKLKRDIGEKYEYSNLGMGFMGHIISRVAGMSYEQLIIKRICNVLGMNSTTITLTPELKKRLAKGHNTKGEVSNWDLPTLAGAGALRSSADDMITFIAANMGLRKSKLTPAMDMSHEARVDASKNMKVALGWHISNNGKTQITWHNGGTGGYRTFCGFIKDKKIGAVVLSNMNIGADDIGYHLLDNSYKLKKIKEEIALEPEVLEKYVGEYRLSEPAMKLTVTRDGNKLSMDFEGQGKVQILPESETQFFMKEADIQITFKMDESGKVSGLIVRQGGKDTEAKKIK